MKNTALCLFNMVLLTCGQVLFRYGAHGRVISTALDVVKLMLTPPMIAAVTLYAGAIILWVYILTKTPISYAYPIQALAFPLVIMMSFFLFKEIVPLTRWIGVAVIVFGVFLASK